MDIKAMHQRFTQLSWQQQLANLASTLARISSPATSPESDELVVHSLREAAQLIEWSAPKPRPTFRWNWQRCSENS